MAGLKSEPAIIFWMVTSSFGRAALGRQAIRTAAPIKNVPLQHWSAWGPNWVGG